MGLRYLMAFTRHQGAPLETAKSPCNVPDGVANALCNWLAYGIQPGRFTSSLLQGDLWAAWRAADWDSRDSFQDIVQFISSHCPVDSYGSHMGCARWIAERLYELPENRQMTMKVVNLLLPDMATAYAQRLQNAAAV